MYRSETQYHDVTVDSGLDPRKVPHYPIIDFMQSVAGRNLAGAAWDQLAAMQAKGAQAMQRDQDIREISVASGIPEVFLHQSVPQGHSHWLRPAPRPHIYEMSEDESFLDSDRYDGPDEPPPGPPPSE